jgi:hypothetical protein
MYNLKSIKEVMDINVPEIIDNVSRRNGMIYILTGSGGSGKSSLLLSFFQKSSPVYRNKFNNIYYICPESSFLSVAKHPFSKHDKIYHELNGEILLHIYSELIDLKEESTKKKKKQKYNLVIIGSLLEKFFYNERKINDIIKYVKSIPVQQKNAVSNLIYGLNSYLIYGKYDNKNKEKNSELMQLLLDKNILSFPKEPNKFSFTKYTYMYHVFLNENEEMYKKYILDYYAGLMKN